jgi:hypothetical protein
MVDEPVELAAIAAASLLLTQSLPGQVLAVKETFWQAAGSAGLQCREMPKPWRLAGREQPILLMEILWHEPLHRSPHLAEAEPVASQLATPAADKMPKEVLSPSGPVTLNVAPGAIAAQVVVTGVDAGRDIEAASLDSIPASRVAPEQQTAPAPVSVTGEHHGPSTEIPVGLDMDTLEIPDMPDFPVSPVRKEAAGASVDTASVADDGATVISGNLLSGIDDGPSTVLPGQTMGAPLKQMRLHFNEKSFTLGEQATFSLGREHHNDLQVQDTRVSRTHARIIQREGRYLLEDTSTNGTFIVQNGESEIFVRNNIVTLRGNGVLSLGLSTYDRNAKKLKFEFS